MIDLNGVVKSFGAKKVLRGLSLTAREGENLILLGASGSGKSVTLKLIAGLIEPDAGEVLVDGENVAELDAEGLAVLRRRLAFVFQFAALFDSMTVEENIRLGLRRQGIDEAIQRDRVEESLAVVQLEGSEARYPAELSGGMRKRVGIARAIALKPRYILYDEPTTGLDPVTSAVIDELMVRTRDLGATGLIVTHDLRTAFSCGDRIAMLHEGKLRAVGTPDEIRRSADPVVAGFIEGRSTWAGEAA
jgi:phospholipid/cholesterol/gamma-HCH transport system ATP-binding protein